MLEERMLKREYSASFVWERTKAFFKVRAIGEEEKEDVQQVMHKDGILKMCESRNVE